MKKIILCLLFFLGLVSTALPIYAETYERSYPRSLDIDYFSKPTKLQLEKNKTSYHPWKDFRDAMLCISFIGLVLFIIFLPVIIFHVVYESLPEDSTLRKIMDIAGIILTIITLGLLCLHKKEK